MPDITDLVKKAVWIMLEVITILGLIEKILQAVVDVLQAMKTKSNVPLRK
jgi:hypothetical protein